MFEANIVTLTLKKIELREKRDLYQVFIGYFGDILTEDDFPVMDATKFRKVVLTPIQLADTSIDPYTRKAKTTYENFLVDREQARILIPILEGIIDSYREIDLKALRNEQERLMDLEDKIYNAKARGDSYRDEWNAIISKRWYKVGRKIEMFFERIFWKE